MLASIFNHTTLTIGMGAGILGIVSGALGAFAVLRKQSLVGDAISHSALPGIVLAFILTGSKAPLVLMIGAGVAGLLGMLIVMVISSNSRVQFDSALGIVLSVFFGVGLLLLTWIQKHPDAAQAGLDRFLFGQAAGLLKKDVWALAGIATLACMCVAAFWKEFKLLSFDPDYGASLGLPMRWLDILLTTLVTVAIVLGLQTVGVVLMSAMIVAPAAAARQWTNRLSRMVIISGIFGGIAGICGALASSVLPHLPTGPAVVLAIGGIVIFSLVAAPGRGLAAEWLRRRKNQHKLRLDAVLTDLYELESHHNEEHCVGHTSAAIEAMSFGEGSVESSLHTLKDYDFVVQCTEDTWRITAQGRERVEKMLEDLGKSEVKFI